MTKHTFLPTTNVEASQKEYLIASKFVLVLCRTVEVDLAYNFMLSFIKINICSFGKILIIFLMKSSCLESYS